MAHRRKKQPEPAPVVPPPATPETPPAGDATWASAQKLVEDIQAGVKRLAPTHEEATLMQHQLIGRSVLAGLAAVLPRVISAVTAARKAYRKPTVNAKARARRFAKAWGV